MLRKTLIFLRKGPEEQHETIMRQTFLILMTWFSLSKSQNPIYTFIHPSPWVEWADIKILSCSTCLWERILSQNLKSPSLLFSLDFLVHNLSGIKRCLECLFQKCKARWQHPSSRYGALITKKQVKQRSLFWGIMFKWRLKGVMDWSLEHTSWTAR